MRVDRIKIRNFRLLSDVELALESQTTLIVGRNNSGKTSLSEALRRLLNGDGKFALEDFSTASYDDFVAALENHQAGHEEASTRAKIPAVELRVTFKYDPTQPELGPLAPFIVDLDPACTTALVVIRYELKDGAIAPFFEGLPTELDADGRIQVFRELRERIPAHFSVKIFAEDPNDPDNRRDLPASILKALIRTGFINAQRGLDDVTTRDSDVIAKVLEGLFSTASAPSADDSDRAIAAALSAAVKDIQSGIDASFGVQLKGLLPALQSFGYPGLGGQELHTETTLDVGKLLSNFTKVRYAGHEGVSLPESYNGLGVRNLIFILLQLVGYYKEYRSMDVSPGVHLVFIEEPEAHLHPQMQEVFIRQLDKVAAQLVVTGGGVAWPVQFVVSTHSSHIANEAGFECIRYFLPSVSATGVRQTKVKDLREGLKDTEAATRKFLHQYLTLTRCDLFFADKAVLVEGLSERLILPVMISKLEEAEPDAPRLSSQYVAVMEVGGAYAHLFLPLLNFLELHSLIITDLDAVDDVDGSACAVHQGATTSNACLKAWFVDDHPMTLAMLTSKIDVDMVKNLHRIAFQCPELDGGPCGRTFEDAFMLANATMFELNAAAPGELELAARKKAGTLKKSEFALKYAIAETSWITPRYLENGVRWLASVGLTAPEADDA